jgi:hypothetical protein
MDRGRRTIAVFNGHTGRWALIAKTHQPRHRGLYAFLIAIVICSGLASRSEASGLPPFFAKYAGDALWALMVFLGIGFVLAARGTALVTALAMAASCADEFSQLYHAPWIDTVRRTTLGHLVLGDTFAWGDIAAYLVRVGFGATAEWVATRIKWCRRNRRSLSDQ